MVVRKFIKNPYLWGFIIGIISLHIVRELALLRKAAPMPLAIVPEWNLIDQNGSSFGKKDLLGKIVVANFFFTSCPTICPKLTEAMKEVYARFQHEKDVHFLSITVDPETDSPAVLKEYMKTNGILYDNWSALTGSKRDIYDVVVNKMKIHVGEKEAIVGSEHLYDISHVAQLALFDQKGDLRGLFKTDSVELSTLVRAMKFFLEER